MTARKNTSKPVNLDLDGDEDNEWNISELAAKMAEAYPEVGTEYKLLQLLRAWHNDPERETPKPSFVFRKTSYWPATEETLADWYEISNQVFMEVESASWTKLEMVNKAVAFIDDIHRTVMYEQTKIRWRDAFNRADAVFDFIMELDSNGIVNNEVREGLVAKLNKMETKAGLRK